MIFMLQGGVILFAYPIKLKKVIFIIYKGEKYVKIMS